MLCLDMVMVSLMYKTGKTHRNVLLSEYSLFHTNYFSISVREKIMSRAAFLDARSCVLEL